MAIFWRLTFMKWTPGFNESNTTILVFGWHFFSKKNNYRKIKIKLCW